MIIAGIDPGNVNVGYAFINYAGGQCSALEYGVISTKSVQSQSGKLVAIYEQIEQLFARHQPTYAVSERLLFSANRKTATGVSQAVGVIMLAATVCGAEWVEYTPMEIKSALTGYGGADKMQVQIMTQKLLKLPRLPEPDHVADALAAAICHAHSVKLMSLGRPK